MEVKLVKKGPERYWGWETVHGADAFCAYDVKKHVTVPLGILSAYVVFTKRARTDGMSFKILPVSKRSTRRRYGAKETEYLEGTGQHWFYPVAVRMINKALKAGYTHLHVEYDYEA